MSTLQEIEAAVDKLSREELGKLMGFVAERYEQESESLKDRANDSFASVIGKYGGAKAATVRNAEEILYGTEN